jgi:hypothetical protein
MTGNSSDPERVFGPRVVLEGDNIGHNLQDENIGSGTVKTAYARILEIGWKAVRRLLYALSGRTVVTIDHGVM